MRRYQKSDIRYQNAKTGTEVIANCQSQIANRGNLGLQSDWRLGIGDWSFWRRIS